MSAPTRCAFPWASTNWRHVADPSANRSAISTDRRLRESMSRSYTSRVSAQHRSRSRRSDRVPATDSASARAVSVANHLPSVIVHLSVPRSASRLRRDSPSAFRGTPVI